MRGQMAHLDAEVLAEFRAGLIAGRRGARITAHLAGCDRCTALDDQLAGVSALLAAVPDPTDRDIDGAMAGNLCRCGTYVRIRAAVHEAARLVAARGGRAGGPAGGAGSTGPGGVR